MTYTWINLILEAMFLRLFSYIHRAVGGVRVGGVVLSPLVAKSKGQEIGRRINNAIKNKNFLTTI
jgi:hypothetical protein